MIIAIAGVSQSGKDTFCGFTNFTRLAFADVLKQQAMNALLSIGIDVNLIKDNQAKKEWRGFLVDLGEWKRNHISKYYWSDIVKEFIITHKDKDICITDCRYLSEAEMIKSLGGKLIYISRADTLPANDVERNSIREILDSGIIDYYIKNDGSLDDLKETAKELIKSI